MKTAILSFLFVLISAFNFSQNVKEQSLVRIDNSNIKPYLGVWLYTDSAYVILIDIITENRVTIYYYINMKKAVKGQYPDLGNAFSKLVGRIEKMWEEGITIRANGYLFIFKLKNDKLIKLTEKGEHWIFIHLKSNME